MNDKWNDFEEVGCDLCGSDKSKNIFKRPDGLCVVECDVCGLAYINPRPKNSELVARYGSKYFDNERSGKSKLISYLKTAHTLPC